MATNPVTREMLGAAHDILLKNGLMLSGVMLEEIYEAMRGRDEQITKLEERIKELEAVPSQEPVGEVYRYGMAPNGSKWHGINWYDTGVDIPHGTKLYTIPPDVIAQITELENKLSSQNIGPLFTQRVSAERLEKIAELERQLDDQRSDARALVGKYQDERAGLREQIAELSNRLIQFRIINDNAQNQIATLEAQCDELVKMVEECVLVMEKHMAIRVGLARAIIAKVKLGRGDTAQEGDAT